MLMSIVQTSLTFVLARMFHRKFFTVCNAHSLSKNLRYAGSKAPNCVPEMHIPALTEHISTLSRSGAWELVNDPFAGALSFACAAMKLGRSAIVTAKVEYVSARD